MRRASSAAGRFARRPRSALHERPGEVGARDAEVEVSPCAVVTVLPLTVNEVAAVCLSVFDTVQVQWGVPVHRPQDRT